MKLIDKEKPVFLIALIVVVFLFIVWIVFFLLSQPSGFLSPLGESFEIEKIIERPLEKYSFENLKKRKAKPSQIKLEELQESTLDYDVYLFSYQSEGRRITGLAHIPNLEGKLPVIIQSRGYVDKDQYETGIGTQPSAQVYASNGFISLAPDFLGYGDSAMPPGDNVWEERFLRPVAVLDLIASVKSLPQADPEKIFLWGHSNGGMISLAVLEISGQNYPTALWAPVSRYFPYDVLFYTFEAEDRGKQLRKLLAEFEKDYDTDRYSIDEYLDWIVAPIQIHQGTADPYIPLSWSDNLVNRLEELGVVVNYYQYPGADHNLQPGWDSAIQRDIEFFRGFFKT